MWPKAIGYFVGPALWIKISERMRLFGGFLSACCPLFTTDSWMIRRYETVDDFGTLLDGFDDGTGLGWPYDGWAGWAWDVKEREHAIDDLRKST